MSKEDMHDNVEVSLLAMERLADSVLGTWRVTPKPRITQRTNPAFGTLFKCSGKDAHGDYWSGFGHSAEEAFKDWESTQRRFHALKDLSPVRGMA
jgi:hypothetical protein